MNSDSHRNSFDKAAPTGIVARWFAHLKSRRSSDRFEPPASRVLFLDDDRRRAEVFLAQHPKAVWVENVVDCLERLREPWDEVHLDHDLGGKQLVASDGDDCGMEVIRWMCKEPREHLRTTRFFVHTHNLVAGLMMVLQMQSSGFKAEFRPFGQDLATILAHNEPDDDIDLQRSLRDRMFFAWFNWTRFWRRSAKKTASDAIRPHSGGEPAATMPQPENCQ
jgi:hypothetical protein